MDKAFNGGCPFEIGDEVVFRPSVRTLGWNPCIEEDGLIPNRRYRIKSIVEDKYLRFDNIRNGWHWHDFVSLEEA